MQGKRRLSPSKSTWASGDKVHTKYEKSCPRFVVWERRYEKDVDIDPLYDAMGAIDETRYSAKLRSAGTKFQREVEISHPIGATGVNIEGRIDFVLDTPQGTVIVEKKSTVSPRRKSSIITKGEVDPHHLAQVVSYMAVKKVTQGRIVVTFWKWSDDLEALAVDGEREFSIEVTPAGDISVDGAPYPSHVRNLQQWYKTCADSMNESDNKLPGRPFIQGYINPCQRCPLAPHCDQYDRTKNVQEFWSRTKDVEMSAGPSAEIIEPKLKKGRKNEQSNIPDRSNPDIDTGRIQDKTSLHRWEVD